LEKFTQEQTINESEAKVLQILGDRVASLQKSLPLNNDGLPLSYVDPQVLINFGLSKENISTDVINKAMIRLDYLEGYPVVNNLPFWEKLDGELLHFYKLFKCYRDLREEEGTRSYNRVSELSSHDVKIIRSLSYSYHWPSRAKAYDFYRERQLAIIRQNNIKKMEDTHFETASHIFDEIKGIISDVIEKMKKNPKDTGEYQSQLRSWFRLAISLQRLSLGLKTDAPSESKDGGVSLITNYNLSQQDNRQINVSNPARQSDSTVKVDKMQEVVDLLKSQGVLEDVLKKDNGGNGHQPKQLIDIGGDDVQDNTS